MMIRVSRQFWAGFFLFVFSLTVIERSSLSGWWRFAAYAWMIVAYAVVMAFAFSGRSLRDDVDCEQAVAVANVLGDPIPAHPPWWQEGPTLLDRFVPAGWPLLLGGPTLMLIALGLGGIVGSGLFGLGFGSALVGPLVLEGTRRGRRKQFAAHVNERLHATGMGGIHSKGKQLVIEIASLELQAQVKRRELEEIDRGLGVDKVAAGSIIGKVEEFVRAQSAESERNSRQWDVRLGLVLTLPAAIVGLLIGLFAKGVLGIG